MARKRSFQVMLSHRERKTIMRFQKRTSSVNARTRCAILLAADTSKGRLRKHTARLLLHPVQVRRR